MEQNNQNNQNNTTNQINENVDDIHVQFILKISEIIDNKFKENQNVQQTINLAVCEHLKTINDTHAKEKDEFENKLAMFKEENLKKSIEIEKLSTQISIQSTLMKYLSDDFLKLQESFEKTHLTLLELSKKNIELENNNKISQINNELFDKTITETLNKNNDTITKQQIQINELTKKLNEFDEKINNSLKTDKKEIQKNSQSDKSSDNFENKTQTIIKNDLENNHIIPLINYTNSQKFGENKKVVINNFTDDNSFLKRLERANTQNINIEVMYITKDSINCQIIGTTGSFYLVSLVGEPTCTCPDHEKHNHHCKHILFVLHKLLELPNVNKKFFSYNEINNAIKNKNISKKTIVVRTK